MFWSVLSTLLVLRLSIVAGIYYSRRYDGRCPEIDFLENFNEEQFSGNWYEVTNYNRDLPGSSGDCAHYKFIKEKGKPLKIEMYMDTYRALTGNLDPLTAGKSGFNTSVLCYDRFVDHYNYYVMGTDYDCVAVVYACRDEGDKHISSAYVLSREPFAVCSATKRRDTHVAEVINSISDFNDEVMKQNKQLGCNRIPE